MKRKGLKLQDQSDFFRQTLDATYEGLQIFSPDWIYLYLNQAGAEHGNSSVKELLGRSLLDCYPGIDQTPLFKKMQKVMLEKRPENFENYFEYPAGGGRWFELFIEPHPSGILIRSVDITKRKELELQYYQSQKMETIGQLAGGVAHDFNNKLGIMLMYCELAMEQTEVSEKVQRYLKNIYDSIEESSDLTQKLLAFSRRQVMDLKVVNLNNLLASHLKGVQAFLEDNIEIKEKLEENLGHIKVDPVQMGQVVLNLLLNSRDAMLEGGTITVETFQVEISEDSQSEESALLSGSYVCLSVSDDGDGIREDIKSDIFDPFFTTKERGKGTGLGLASVHGIVKQSHGHIAVESEEGVGSTFRIYLPSVKKMNSGEKEVRQDEQMEFKGSEFVLVVEDDESLGEGCVEVLVASGYQAKLIHHPRDAIEFFEQNKDKIDIVLTDLMMPDLNGDELACFFLAERPGIKIIYASGYAGHHVNRCEAFSKESVLIQKPMTKKVLLSTLRGVLDGKISKGLY